MAWKRRVTLPAGAAGSEFGTGADGGCCNPGGAEVADIA